MIVLDASVIVDALSDPAKKGIRAREAMGRDLEWTAPEHWQAEVFSGIRGLFLGGRLPEARAARIVERIRQLGIATEATEPLLRRMWQLRHAMTGYDAAYVALADLRGIALITGDARLARAAAGHCRIELIR